MSARLFTLEQIWYGGFFELALEVGSRSDERLQAVLEAIWTHPSLEGCYASDHVEPHEQVCIEPSLDMSGEHRCYGLATMPNQTVVPCGSLVIREDSGLDWAMLFLPMVGLSLAYPVGGYPFDAQLEPHIGWLETIETWLFGLGKHVHERSAFQLGLIGLEVSAELTSAELKARGIPQQRCFGILQILDAQLSYFPRNVLC